MNQGQPAFGWYGIPESIVVIGTSYDPIVQQKKKKEHERQIQFRL